MTRSRLGATALVSILALSLAHAPAHAQLGRLWHIGFGGGVSVPAGDLKDALKDGVHGQAFLGFGPFSSPFGGRIAVNYQRFDLKSLEGSATSPSTGSGTVLSGLANMMYGINVGPIHPYLTAGLGAFDLTASPDGGSSSSKVHFGVDGGAGLQVRLGRIEGFVEGRYENLFTDKGLDPNATSAKSFAAQIIPITFGITY